MDVCQAREALPPLGEAPATVAASEVGAEAGAPKRRRRWACLRHDEGRAPRSRKKKGKNQESSAIGEAAASTATSASTAIGESEACDPPGHNNDIEGEGGVGLCLASLFS